MTNNSVGYRIKKLREEKGLSQKQLAEIIECAQTTIAGWEALPNRSPGKKFIGKVAEVLGVSVDYLLIDKEADSPKIPCYAEVSKDNFAWQKFKIQNIDIAKDEYKPGRFSLRLNNSSMEPFISKGDYCIFEKKTPKDRDIVVVRFPEKENEATIKMWRKVRNGVVLTITNPYDSRLINFYCIHKEEKDSFLINWKPKETMVVEGILVGIKKYMKK